MTFKIPIIYKTSSDFDVEAETIVEAIEKALIEFYSIPDDGYMGEITIDVDYIKENYDTTFDITKIKSDLL